MCNQIMQTTYRMFKIFGHMSSAPSDFSCILIFTLKPHLMQVTYGPYESQKFWSQKIPIDPHNWSVLNHISYSMVENNHEYISLATTIKNTGSTAWSQHKIMTSLRSSLLLQLTNLQDFFDSFTLDHVFSFLELIWTAIGQTRIQSAQQKQNNWYVIILLWQ